MPRPGDVVTVQFAGATSSKRRPAIVVSNDAYHAQRPDLILGVVTSKINLATCSSDHVIKDWKQAGLRRPSAFRCYLGMEIPTNVQVIGHLSDYDWKGVQTAVQNSVS